MKLYDFLKCKLGCAVLAHFELMHFIKWLEKKSINMLTVVETI